ncbi:MAG: hypothetical protein J5623_08625 [Clostridiales bacterium]|nr:hypothetical protein [Clostridiales bacterium]
MKKRLLTSIVLLAMAFSLTSCKKAPSGDSGATGSSGSATGSVSVATENTAVPDQIKFAVDGKYIIFRVSKKISLETDAWIGICLKGDYVYEEDADDNQFTYSFFDEGQSDASDYYFKVSVEDIEDGEYSMVLCSTDNVGYVVASWGLTIRNGKPEVDYSIFKINQKPKDIGETEAPAGHVEDEEDDDDDYYDESENDDYGDGGDDGADDDEEE